MEKEPINKDELEEIAKIPEQATDMELVIFLSGHIDNPCGVEVEPGKKENIREFYLNEARKMLPNMKNEAAKEILELKIKEYK